MFFLRHASLLRLLIFFIVMFFGQSGTCKRSLQFSTLHNSTKVLDFDFFRDFTTFNPRSPASAFAFFEIDTATGLRQDNAAFLLDSKNRILNMVSVPFNHWLPQSYGIGASLAVYEAAARLVDPVDVRNGEVFRFDIEFNCRTVNTKLHPFPNEYVLDSDDDPRLASCIAGFSDLNVTGIGFGFYAANAGIWATYTRNAVTRRLIDMNSTISTKPTYDTFEVYRRVGTRRNPYEIVQARIELDRSINETRFYLNRELVWVVGSWGILTPELLVGNTQGNRLISFNPGNPTNVTALVNNIADITILLETTHKLQQADPNRSDNDGLSYSPGLVRINDLLGYYSPLVEFYDNSSERYNSIWGQGAIMGLKSMRVRVWSPKEAQSSGDADNSYDPVENKGPSNDTKSSVSDEAAQQNTVQNYFVEENSNRIVHVYPKAEQPQQEKEQIVDEQDAGYGLNARQLARLQSQYEPEDVSLPAERQEVN